MNIEQLQSLAIEALEDLKGLDIVTLNVRDLTTITDTMIICTGRSSRHVASLAENVVVKAKHAKAPYVRLEGAQNGEWIIVDLADVIIHVMQPAAREFYKLEDLWEPIIESRNHKR